MALKIKVNSACTLHPQQVLIQVSPLRSLSESLTDLVPVTPIYLT
jgi:hypothetical protein